MATYFQVVRAGAVVNVIACGDGAALVDGAISTGDGATITPTDGESFHQQDGAAIGWIVSGGALAPPTLAPVVLTKSQLADIANSHQWALAMGGHTLTISGTPYLFPTDESSLGLMTGKAVRLMQPGAPTSVDWQLPGGFVTISATDFFVAAAALADWVQSTFEALKVVLAAIEAGTITTGAQIEAASWPAR